MRGKYYFLLKSVHTKIGKARIGTQQYRVIDEREGN